MMYHYTNMISDERHVQCAGSASQKLTAMLDAFAISASVGCMIHCLGLPLLLAFLPAFSDLVNPGETFHVLMLAIAVPASAFALISGWRRHRALIPLLVGVAGLLLMASAIAFARSEAMEITITVTGSIFVASAHIANWRYRRSTARAACSPQI